MNLSFGIVVFYDFQMNPTIQSCVAAFNREIHKLPRITKTTRYLVVYVDPEGYFGLQISNTTPSKILCYLSTRKFVGIKAIVSQNPQTVREYFLNKLGVKTGTYYISACSDLDRVLKVFNDALGIPSLTKKRKISAITPIIPVQDNSESGESDDEELDQRDFKNTFSLQKNKLETHSNIESDSNSSESSELELISPVSVTPRQQKKFLSNVSAESESEERPSIKRRKLNVVSPRPQKPKVQFCGFCGKQKIHQKHLFCSDCGEKY